MRQALAREVLDETPSRRSVPRTLRHFHMPPRLSFSMEGSRTRLGLVCSDRPGLLASVARIFRDCGLRVHDARIATFGERVEDFFQITDEHDRPLDAAAQQILREALSGLLDSRPATSSRAVHASH